MKLNNKGFGLLEVLTAAILMGMIGWGIQTVIINAIKQSIKISKSVDKSIARGAAGKYTVIYLDDNLCHHPDNSYWVKKYNTSDVMLYSDSACRNAIGTIGALANDTFFNDVDMTQWIVSVYPGRLRMLVTNLKK